MAGQIQCGRRVRQDFGKIPSIVEIPNLIEIQQQSYEHFLQKDVRAGAARGHGAAGGVQVRVSDRGLQRERHRWSSTATTSATRSTRWRSATTGA